MSEKTKSPKDLILKPFRSRLVWKIKIFVVGLFKRPASLILLIVLVLLKLYIVAIILLWPILATIEAEDGDRINGINSL
jgi:hypothetical protein